MTDDVLHNKYSLVRGAARRARQLQNGAAPTIATKSMKACRVAQDEIRQGQVSYMLTGKKPSPGAETPAVAEPVIAPTVES
jgi:DNA-directed RNA polymerase subunit omega